MKKKWVIAIVVAVAVMAVVVLIVLFAPKKEAYMLENSGSSAEKAQAPTQPQPQAETTTPAPTQPATQPGKYVNYTDDIIAKTPGTKILFFHAPWCPQCRALEESIKKGKIPDGVTIIKVDYDTHEKLRQKYGVTVQTTLVRVNDAGNLVKKYLAYSTPNLEAVIKNLL